MNLRTMRHMLSEAYGIAQRSKDPSSQNGALIATRSDDPDIQVDLGRVKGGYNQFYEGIPANYTDRDVKLRGIEHAERDVIYNAAGSTFNTQGAYMFCPWAACTDCARAIIGAQLEALIYHEERYQLTDPRWKENVDEALSWLRASGVFVYGYSGSMYAHMYSNSDSTHKKELHILVSGKLWSPVTLEFVDNA